MNNGNVIVNDANGLNAGDYYFKINAIDSNGAPVGDSTISKDFISVIKLESAGIVLFSL